MSLPARLLLLSTLAAGLFVVAAAPPAWAQVVPKGPPGSAARTDGTVIAIDAGDLVLDLGAAKGVSDGVVVELWRPLRLRHPVTGQMLVDRFRIGTLRLVQVRSTLSLAIVDGPLTRPPATGDVVIVPDGSVREAAAAPPPATKGDPGPPPSPPVVITTVAPQDPDASALGVLMGRLAGAEPELRAQAYETFAQSHPKSRFGKVLREEALALRGAREHDPGARGFESSTPKLDRVRIGEPQRFAVELDPRFIGAVVHVRRRGAAGYRSVPMETVGPRYWAATLPGDAMTDRGMEYFVEGVSQGGGATALVGTADAPRQVEVDPPALYVPKGAVPLAQASIQSEYASFNTKRANDYVWQTEGSVGWRLRDEGIRAVRSGFGVLRGEGGSLHDLDTLNKPPESVGLTYGYVEAEVTISSTYAVIGRPILGLREQGITGGASAFVRVGNDLRTNLIVGGEVLGGVGQRGIVELDWRTIKRVPIVLRTEVTTQPRATGDVGARAIAQIGYQIVPELTVAGRASYQGRTINHAGPGAGLAVSYQW